MMTRVCVFDGFLSSRGPRPLPLFPFPFPFPCPDPPRLFFCVTGARGRPEGEPLRLPQVTEGEGRGIADGELEKKEIEIERPRTSHPPSLPP